MISSFNPVIQKDSKVLIAGSVPGAESLRRGQYYGFPGNHFWKIIFTILNGDFTDDYDQRIAFLRSGNIALWDIVESCERKGSLDSAIKNYSVNDFDSLLRKYSNIQCVCFNGAKAHDTYIKNRSADSRKIDIYKLPSTSPANTMKLQDKIDQWSVILRYL